MKILIDRKWKKEGYTISKVYVDGEDFHCNCLEDPDRGLYQGMSTADVLAVKEKGKTAIPRGTYHVIYTYSPRFKRRLPLLENVTGFAGIRIHPGNSDKDTEGCLLFGKNDKVGWISDSKLWTLRIIEKMKEAWGRNEKVTVTIQ